jgi:hypothetical protein
MGNEAAQFDGRKFGYLGIPSPYDTVCTFNQQSGITKMDDWINAKRPQKISTIGPGTSTSDIPKLLKAALNLPMDVIDGYKGGADARLAVESGESTATVAPGERWKRSGAAPTKAKKSFPFSRRRSSLIPNTNKFPSQSTMPRPKKRASCYELRTTFT